jgi:hypothetical protein
MIAGNNFARTKETPLNARDGYVIYDCIGGKQFNYPGFPTEKCPDKVSLNAFPEFSPPLTSLPGPSQRLLPHVSAINPVIES